MVNMYSMGSMGMMQGMNGMYNSTGNVHQDLKNRYGVGYEDFNSMPYAQPYPFAISPQPPQTETQKSWFLNFLKRCFS